MQLIGNLCRWNIKMQLSISSNCLHPLCCQSSLGPHPFLLSYCIHSCSFPIHHEQGSPSGLWKINILIPYCPKPFFSFPLLLSCGEQGHGWTAPHHVSTYHLLPVYIYYPLYSRFLGQAKPSFTEGTNTCSLPNSLHFSCLDLTHYSSFPLKWYFFQGPSHDHSDSGSYPVMWSQKLRFLYT